MSRCPRCERFVTWLSFKHPVRKHSSFEEVLAAKELLHWEGERVCWDCYMDLGDMDRTLLQAENFKWMFERIWETAFKAGQDK